MADVKISELPEASLLDTVADLVLSQEGVTVKAPLNEVVLSADYPVTDNIVLSFVSVSPSGRCTIGDLSFSYKGSPVVLDIASSSWSINVNPVGTVENMFDGNPLTYLQIDNPTTEFAKLSIMLNTPVAIDSITVTATTDDNISIDQAPALISLEFPNAIGYSFNNQSAIWTDWATPGETKTLNSPKYVISRSPLEVVAFVGNQNVNTLMATRIDYKSPRAYAEKLANPRTLTNGYVLAGEVITITDEPQREVLTEINSSTTFNDSYFSSSNAVASTKILVNTTSGDITITLIPTTNPQPDRNLNRIGITRTFLNTGPNNIILDVSAFTTINCNVSNLPPTAEPNKVIHILEYGSAGEIFIWGDLAVTA